MSQHNGGELASWSRMTKTGETHPVVYSAWGSHGLYKESGCHTFSPIDLVDMCGEGSLWDTWENVEAFDYNEQQGLGRSKWPVWMSTDYKNKGVGDPQVPGNGPIFRWGNASKGAWMFGHHQLSDGPTGPVDKRIWKN
eukprot:m51a1_g7516 hypothetical protein (138) ;mRNA; r:1096-1509